MSTSGRRGDIRNPVTLGTMQQRDRVLLVQHDQEIEWRRFADAERSQSRMCLTAMMRLVIEQMRKDFTHVPPL